MTYQEQKKELQRLISVAENNIKDSKEKLESLEQQKKEVKVDNIWIRPNGSYFTIGLRGSYVDTNLIPDSNYRVRGCFTKCDLKEIADGINRLLGEKG